jgi:hypothetical protein
MDRVKVFRVRVVENGWEVPVVIGANESRGGVGFLVNIESEYWSILTGGVCSPERLCRITFDFLLQKKGSEFSIDRKIDITKLAKEFPDYEEEVRKKLVGAFGL